MPGTITEKPKRRRQWGETPQTELRYVIKGASLETDARDLLLGAGGAPSTLDGLIRKNYGVDELGSGVWDGFATYGASGPLDAKKPAATGDIRRGWSTTGGTQRILQSLETVASYVPPDATVTPDFYGAIGVTKDSIEGADIVVPQVNLSITAYLPVATVTDSYMAAVENLTGTVNDATYKGRPAGSLLFMGVDGSQRNEDDWELDFKFAYSKNVTGKTIGTITGIAKLGWEYLWVLYDDVEDTTAKRCVKRPAAVYVMRVYENAAFGALGI